MVRATWATFSSRLRQADQRQHAAAAIGRTLTDEEERSIREGLSEEELSIFDLLTKPNPVLTGEEREPVKASAKTLLKHRHDKLVQDPRRKVAATADVETTIGKVLD